MDERKLIRALHAEQFKAGVRRCSACGKVGLPYYYFVNIRHPAIGRLWEQWKKQRRILGAASDEERLAFEVGLLNEEAKRALWETVRESKTEERQEK